MNDEKSGELEDRRKEALNDSVNSGSETRQGISVQRDLLETLLGNSSNSRSFVYLCTAVDGNGSEDLKPPDSKRFQLQMDETLEKIRETEEKLVPLVALC